MKKKVTVDFKNPKTKASRYVVRGEYSDNEYFDVETIWVVSTKLPSMQVEYEPMTDKEFEAIEDECYFQCTCGNFDDV